MATVTSVQHGPWDQAATWDTGVPGLTDNVVVSHNVSLPAGSTGRNANTNGTGKLTIGSGSTLCLNTSNTLSVATVDLDGGTIECAAGASVSFSGVTFLDDGSGKVDVLGTIMVWSCDFSGCPSGTEMIIGGNTDTFIIASPAPSLPYVNIWSYGGGEVTTNTDLACKGFEYNASATGYDNNGKTVTVQGDLTINGTSGFISTGVFVHGGGNLKNDNSGALEMFAHLKMGQFGARSTMSGNVRFVKVTVGPGDNGVAAEMGYTWKWYPTGPGDWVEETGHGTMAGLLDVCFDSDVSLPGMSMPGSFSSAGVRVLATADNKKAILAGDWDLGSATLKIVRYDDTEVVQFDTNGHAVKCGTMQLGYENRQDVAKVWLRNGAHQIAAIERASGNNRTDHELHLGSGTVRLTDYLDGTGLSIDAGGAVIADGEIRDVTLPAGNWLRAWGCKDGGGSSAGDRIEYTQRTIREAVPA